MEQNNMPVLPLTLPQQLEIARIDLARLEHSIKIIITDIESIVKHLHNHASSIESIIQAFERHEQKHSVGDITGIWT